MIVFELLGENLYDWLKGRQFLGASLPAIRYVGQQVLATLRFLHGSVAISMHAGGHCLWSCWGPLSHCDKH
jgi:hypothetical protein